MLETIQRGIDSRLEFFDERKLPAILTASEGETLDSLFCSDRANLAAAQRRYGALLFRGFGLSTAEDFRGAVGLWFENGLRDYIGGVSPRDRVMSGVYESTKFPEHLRIPQHNEMSYLPDPPRELAFFCEIEPQHGGETPLADARTIYDRMPEETRDAFEAKGISYHRYLFGSKWNARQRNRQRIAKLHTSWRAAFSTENRSIVEQFCAENGGTVEWDKEDGAMINNVLQAVRRHPETGEMLWFNQTSTFLSSPKATGLVRWLLYQIFYAEPLRRPFHATFGDGTPITLRQVNTVHEVIESATSRFRWQRGDLLLVDNFLVTHGRMPFRGDRRILVSIH